jgi:hypothetical protein
MAEYYNTHIRCNEWINGREHDQLEEVPNSEVVDFGVEKAGCPKLTQCAIENVREGFGNTRRGEGILFAS